MDVSMDLSKMKVADLKKELKLRSLSTTGKRSDLLERLQSAIAEGVEAAVDDEEEYDEDEILAGDDDDDDSKMTPMEEAAALAAAEKATSTPARGRRAVAVAAATPATPKTPGRKLAIKRGATATPVAPAAAAPAAAAAAAVSPVKTGVAVKRTAKQATISAPATGDTPVATDSPAQPAAKVVKLAADADTKANGATVTEVPVVKSSKELRAERFGIKSEEVTKQQRAERFGVTAKPGKLSMDVGTVDVDKLKARAARFGTTTAKVLTKAETDEKKKARNERFGNGTSDSAENKKDLTSEEAKAARAAKFATAAPSAVVESDEPIISATGKKVITVGGSADEVMKLKRAARFGAA